MEVALAASLPKLSLTITVLKDNFLLTHKDYLDRIRPILMRSLFFSLSFHDVVTTFTTSPLSGIPFADYFIAFLLTYLLSAYL